MNSKEENNITFNDSADSKFTSVVGGSDKISA